jgi:hypothetical protein
VERRFKEGMYERKTSPERILKEKHVDSFKNNYNNSKWATSESFTFSSPSVTDDNNNISPLFFKEVRDIKKEYGIPNYNMNAPKYKPKLTKIGTQIVEEEEDLYTESDNEE